MFVVLSGPRFSSLTSLIGYSSVLVLGWEIWRTGRITEAPKYLLYVIHFGFFVLTCIAVIPLIPYAAPRAKTVITGFILFACVFLIIRLQGHARIVQYAYVFIIFGICVLIALDPSLAFDSGERLRLSSSLLGQDAEGLNASNISTYFGFGMFMAVGLMIYLKDLKHHIKLFQKLIYWGLWCAIGVAVAVIVIYTGSRQGLVWVILVSGLMGVVFFRKNLGLAVVAAVILMFVGAFLFAVFGKNTVLYERIFLILDSEARTFEGENSFYSRMDMIKYALGMWQQSPIWGNGNEAFRIEYGKYSHNNYMELLANYGLIGFGFFYMSFAILLLKLLPLLRSNVPLIKNESAWVIACLIAYLASNMFMPCYYNRPSLAFLAFVIGKGWFLVDVSRKQVHRRSLQ